VLYFDDDGSGDNDMVDAMLKATTLQWEVRMVIRMSGRVIRKAAVKLRLMK
jgi:hypothetical protein